MVDKILIDRSILQRGMFKWHCAEILPFHAKVPARITFAGGGTDKQNYFTTFQGKIVNATIDLYSRITIEPGTENSYEVYSTNLNNEVKFKSIEKEIEVNQDLKLVLMCMCIFENVPPIKITIDNDFPIGSGLGGSSSLVVALVSALLHASGNIVDRSTLLNICYHIERDWCGISGGWQDHCSAVFKGVNVFNFHKNLIERESIPLSMSQIHHLSESLFLLNTGITRDGGMIHHSIDTSSLKYKFDKQLHEIYKMAISAETMLRNKDFDNLGGLMDKGWRLKRLLSEGISSPHFDTIYDAIINSGSLGGRLLGAGGGGYMLFQVLPGKKHLTAEVVERLGLEWQNIRIVET